MIQTIQGCFSFKLHNYFKKEINFFILLTLHCRRSKVLSEPNIQNILETIFNCFMVRHIDSDLIVAYLFSGLLNNIVEKNSTHVE